MRIGIFVDAYEPYVSGVTTSIKMLKISLENMGHQVYIVTANLSNNKFIYDENNKIIYIPGIKTGIYETKLTSIYSTRAIKIIKSWNLDVIHSHTEFGIGVFSRIVAKQLKLPIVHTYHTLWEDYVYYITHGFFDKFSKSVVRKVTKYICENQSDELIVPTEKIKDLFITKYNVTCDINVIPTGIDTTRFELNDKLEKSVNSLKRKHKIKNDDFIIGAVGRVAKEKSFDKLIETMDKLIKSNYHFKLMIVGDGPDIDNLKKLVKDLKISNNVIFTGKVKYDLIPAYYNLFDIMTSFSTTETQGLTIIEALAASTPVVCINDDSFNAMIEDTYNGFIFNEPEEFINHVINLKGNQELYKTISLNAKNSIHKYSKEVFASDVLKIYHKAINDKKQTIE